MCAGLGRLCLLFDKVSCPKCTNLVDGSWLLPMQMSPSWLHTHTIMMVHYLVMLHSIGECHFLDMHMPFKTRAIHRWCWLLLVDVPCLKCIIFGLWCMPLANVNVTQSIHTYQILCVHTFDDNRGCCLILIYRCAQTTSDAWSTWLVLPTIGRHCLADICSTQPMSVIQCAQSTMLNTLLFVHEIGLCTHATSDVCRPWFFLLYIGQCRLANSHRSHAMFLGQCI